MDTMEPRAVLQETIMPCSQRSPMKLSSKNQSSTASLALLVALAALGATAAPPYLGRPIADVLESFGAEGVSFVYSSNLVSSDLRVLNEPRSHDPHAVASEILAEHGLSLTKAGDLFLVVRSDETTTYGSIRVALAYGEPGPGSVATRIELTGPSTRSISFVDTEFDLTNLLPGRYELVATAILYQPESVVVEVTANAVADAFLRLEPAVPPLEELMVGASRYDMTGDFQHSNAYFTRAEVEHLSDLGGDPVRAVHRLPGAAAGGVSARSYVRGGDNDEMIYLLDGMRLTDPFHARDFQSVFSTIDHRAISSIQVYSGGFPARYGDSLSGVMLIEPRAPDARLHHELGLSTLSASALTSGTFNEGQGEWLASMRRGTVDLLLDPQRGKPTYGSLYGHLGVQLGRLGSVSINGLASEDDILAIVTEDPEEQERARSDTENGQIWIKLETDWTDRLRSETLISSARFTNARQGNENDAEEIVGYVDDVRTLDVHGLKQEWAWLLSDRHLMNWGFEAEGLSAAYRYSSSVDLYGFLASFEGVSSSVRRDIVTFPTSRTYSLHVSDRMSFGSSAVAEFGLRWDKQTHLPTERGENQISPRLSFLYQLGPRSNVRASWGRFFQSQGLLQLQVEDGVQEFSPAQSAKHYIASFEHRLRNDLVFRVETYRKTLSDLRPRYENLFNSLSLLPELQPDRVRIAPGRAESAGVELLVSRDTLRPLSWWASYTLARVDDVVFARDIPRSWDQRHRLAGGVTWSGAKWVFTAAANYHTGWPATEMFLLPERSPVGIPQMITVPGERNALRLGSYSRVDLRAERSMDTPTGRFRFFVETTNLLERANPCCVEYDLEHAADGTPFLARDVGRGVPRFLSAGVRWEF